MAQPTLCLSYSRKTWSKWTVAFKTKKVLYTSFSAVQTVGINIRCTIDLNLCCFYLTVFEDVLVPAYISLQLLANYNCWVLGDLWTYFLKSFGSSKHLILTSYSFQKAVALSFQPLNECFMFNEKLLLLFWNLQTAEWYDEKSREIGVKTAFPFWLWFTNCKI